MFVESLDTATHKTCGDCGEKKLVSEFYKDGKDKDGNDKYRRDCKKCYNEKRDNEKRMLAKRGGRKR